MNYPKKDDIRLWIPAATDIFQSIMPPISVPYPPTYIAGARDWEETRAKLLEQTGCKHNEQTEAAVMEAIDGLSGRKTLLIIAHRLTTIRNCGIVYEIKDGRVTRTR